MNCSRERDDARRGSSHPNYGDGNPWWGGMPQRVWSVDGSCLGNQGRIENHQPLPHPPIHCLDAWLLEYLGRNAPMPSSRWLPESTQHVSRRHEDRCPVAPHQRKSPKGCTQRNWAQALTVRGVAYENARFSNNPPLPETAMPLCTLIHRDHGRTRTQVSMNNGQTPQHKWVVLTGRLVLAR